MIASAPSIIEYQWVPAMTTGDFRIDEQHKELIRQLNLLLAAMSQGRGAVQLEMLMNFLADYTAKHFSYEEQCMEKFHCPIAQTNKNAHTQFLRKFESFRERLTASKGNESAVTIGVLRELSDWLMTHIRCVDTQLNRCIH